MDDQNKPWKVLIRLKSEFIVPLLGVKSDRRANGTPSPFSPNAFNKNFNLSSKLRGGKKPKARHHRLCPVAIYDFCKRAARIKFRRRSLDWKLKVLVHF